MLRHYVENILPNGFKAQVVAYSRLAAVRYHSALREARDELVEEALSLDEQTRRLDDGAQSTSRDRLRSAVRAWRYLDLLTKIEFAPIISPDNNDDPGWKEWTDAAKIESRIARFKKPLVDPDPKKTRSAGVPHREVDAAHRLRRADRGRDVPGPVDPGGGAAPGHRPREPPRRGKAAGIVVDYFGVARHLKEALAAYSAEDIEGALQSLKDEIPKLRDRRDRCAPVRESGRR